jgi:multidrug efflux system outer membrane protein
MKAFSSVRLALAIALAVGTTACAVGPDYQRPGLVVPSLFRGEHAAVESASLGDKAWSDIFSDPVLAQLISEGLSNNYDLRMAAARVDEYRAYAGVARGALFPQIGAGIGYDADNASYRADPSSSASDDTSRNWNAGVQLSWELDLFGRLRRENEAALARWLASEQGRRSVMVTLVADISTAYFTLRQYDLELEIARRTLVSNTELAKYYRTRLEGGASNRLEVDQAEANRAITAARIPDFERRIAVQENLINLLVGRAPASIPRGHILTDQALPPTLAGGLPLQLLERRPDILQAEQELAAANADIGAAKALFFPNISITAFTGGLGRDFSDLGKGDAAIWSAGSSVLQPLFRGGAIRFNYEAAKARFDRSLAQYQKTVQNSFRETADAIVTIEKTRAAKAEVELSVAALQDAAQLSRERYEGGLSSYLDILIADQALFSAELQLAEVRGAEYVAVANLYRALGGGWQVGAAAPLQEIQSTQTQTETETAEQAAHKPDESQR